MPNQICTSTQVKNYLFGLASAPTTFDAFWDQTIPQVEALIKDITGVVVTVDDTAYTTVTNEVLNGTGENVIKALFKPVRAVSKIEYRDANYAFKEQTDVLYADCEYDDNKIYTKDYVLIPQGIRNGRITYTCGYKSTEIPADLTLCAIILVAGLFNQRNNIGFKSQSVFGLSVSLEQEDHAFVTRVLNKYKNVVVL